MFGAESPKAESRSTDYSKHAEFKDSFFFLNFYAFFPIFFFHNFFVTKRSAVIHVDNGKCWMIFVAELNKNGTNLTTMSTKNKV